MNKQPLVNFKGSKMKVGILMSGSGTNAINIIEKSKKPSSHFKVKLIFTDNPNSNAKKIGRKYNISTELLDINKFTKKMGLDRYNLEDRKVYDQKVAEILDNYNIDSLAYAGYMNITTQPIIKNFLGLNVHPADLSIKNKKGERKYTGDKAVLDAIKEGEKTISSTTHIITKGVDEGPLVMISKPIKVQIPKELSETNEKDLKKIADINQERLKKEGDWIIFPKTIELIAQKKIKQDQESNLYFKDQPIPNGIRLGKDL